MLLVTFIINIVSSTYQHSQYSQAAEEEIIEPIRRRGPCSLLTCPLWLRPQCEAHFKQGHHWRVHCSELTFINGRSLLQSQLLSVWDCRSLWTWQVWMQLASAPCIYSLYILDSFGVMIIIVIKMVPLWCCLTVIFFSDNSDSEFPFSHFHDRWLDNDIWVLCFYSTPRVCRHLWRSFLTCFWVIWLNSLCMSGLLTELLPVLIEGYCPESQAIFSHCY